jgi:hypothetical protein
METIAPWLLLLMAALIVACVSLFFQLRQVESQSRGRELILSDELRDAEAALLSALEKVRKMDSSLAARERDLAERHQPPSTTRSPDDRQSMAVRSRPAAIIVGPRRASGEVRLTPAPADRGQEGPLPGAVRDARRTRRVMPSVAHWRLRAIELARTGRTPLQIARELEQPVGEVELVIALQSRRETSH